MRRQFVISLLVSTLLVSALLALVTVGSNEVDVEVDVEVEAEGLIGDFGPAAGGAEWIFAGEWSLEAEEDDDGVVGEFSAVFSMVKADGTGGHTMILTDSVITELSAHSPNKIHIRGTVDVIGPPGVIADDAEFHISIFHDLSGVDVITIVWIDPLGPAAAHLGADVLGTLTELDTEGL